MPSRSSHRNQANNDADKQEGTNNIPFSENEKVEDADDFHLGRPEDLKETAQRQLDEAKEKYEMTKKLVTEATYNFDSDFEHAHRSLGQTININYPGLFENPLKYEKDPSSIIRALARRRHIVLQLSLELNKIQDEIHQAQRSLDFATFHPSQLLPMMDNLQDQIHEQNKDIRQLNAELTAYQNYNKRYQQQRDENKEYFNGIISEFEQKVAENSSQCKSKSEEALNELKKLQEDQKSQFHQDISLMLSLVGMQQQVQEHDLDEIRVEFEGYQQMNSKSDEWEVEYKTRFEQQKSQDQQTAVQFSKEISQIRSIINSITQKQNDNISQVQEIVKEIKKQRAIKDLRKEEENNQAIQLEIQEEEERIAYEDQQKTSEEVDAYNSSSKNDSTLDSKLSETVAKRSSTNSTPASQPQRPALKLEQRYSSSQTILPAKQAAKADRYASQDQIKPSATSPRNSINSQRFASQDQRRPSQVEKPVDQSRPTRSLKAQPQETRSVSKGRPAKAK